MQNDVLFNKVMNKIVVITLEILTVDGDCEFNIKDASVGPATLKTMQPPFGGIVHVIDIENNVISYEFALHFDFIEEEKIIELYTQSFTIKGMIETDSWEVTS